MAFHYTENRPKGRAREDLIERLTEAGHKAEEVLEDDPSRCWWGFETITGDYGDFTYLQSATEMDYDYSRGLDANRSGESGVWFLFLCAEELKGG